MEYTNDDAINETEILRGLYDLTKGFVLVSRRDVEAELARPLTQDEWDNFARRTFEVAFATANDLINEIRELDDIRQADADLLNELKENNG